MTNSEDQDLPLKLAFAKIIWYQGYQPFIELNYSLSYETDKEALTDVDIFGIKLELRGLETIIAAEAKSGRNVLIGQQISRLSGLMNMENFDQVVLVHAKSIPLPQIMYATMKNVLLIHKTRIDEVYYNNKMKGLSLFDSEWYKRQTEILEYVKRISKGLFYTLTDMRTYLSWERQWYGGIAVIKEITGDTKDENHKIWVKGLSHIITAIARGTNQVFYYGDKQAIRGLTIQLRGGYLNQDNVTNIMRHVFDVANSLDKKFGDQITNLLKPENPPPFSDIFLQFATELRERIELSHILVHISSLLEPLIFKNSKQILVSYSPFFMDLTEDQKKWIFDWINKIANQVITQIAKSDSEDFLKLLPNDIN